MSEELRIGDYTLLERHASSLQQCSLDEHDGGDGVYMMGDEADVEAIDFDGVTREYCDGLTRGLYGHAGGYPRSVDALYLGGSEGSRIALIEFKNGSLYGHDRPKLSKRDRQRMDGELRDVIDTVLCNHMTEIDHRFFSAIEEELERGIQRVVAENFGRHSGRQRAEGSHTQERSYTLETVKTKAMCSAYLLQCILDKPVSYINEDVDFILVYNPDMNPQEGEANAVADDRSVPRIGSVERVLPGSLARLAGRPLERFGLKRALWPFFRNVITCTPDELRELYLFARD